MKSKWVGAVLGILLLNAALCNASEKERMTKEELLPLLGNPDVIVMDVRTGGDYKSSTRKIQGAIRENPIDVENWYKKYPQEKTLVLYCT
jgi:hypothetical protein